MKKKTGLLLIAFALILVFALAGCTESYKQEAIPGDYTDATVISESGLVTQLYAGGKYYLYFVNGVAGQSIEDNTFGKVLKGSVMRVELDGKDGNPKLNTKTVVVPKNIFATDAESSFRIRGNYIYYSTPSVLKDKDGNAKTSEMVLMRTSLDGTDTEIIKTFNAEEGGFSNIYRVTENEIVYYYNYELFRIDLKASKFESVKIVEEVAAYQFPTGADYVLYTKANEDSNEYSNRVFLLPFSATSEDGAKILINKASYGDELLHPNGYSITLNVSRGTADELELFYTKTDEGTTKLSAGIYRYVFDLKNGFADGKYAFDASKEERITANGGKSYTAFDKIDENSMYATDSNGIYFLVKEKNTQEGLTLDWKIMKKAKDGDAENDITANIVVSGAKFFRYEEKDGNGTIYYFNGSKLQFRTVFTVKDDGSREITMNNSYDLYTIAATTSWLNYRLIGNNLYFVNSSVSNYVYYVDITTFAVRKTDYSNVLLSDMTEADKIALMSDKAAS